MPRLDFAHASAEFESFFAFSMAHFLLPRFIRAQHTVFSTRLQLRPV